MSLLDFAKNFFVVKAIARVFEGRPEADKFGEEHYAGWAKGLAPRHIDAISNYKDAGYQLVNSYARGSFRPPTQASENHIKDNVKHLDEVVATAPRTPEDLTVWRGIHKDLKDAFVPGDTFVDHGFVSTSLRASIASSAHAYNKDGTVVKIHVPAGSPGAYIDAAAHSCPGNKCENEFLLPRGSKFKINGISDGGAYGQIVHASLLPPDRPADEIYPKSTTAADPFSGRNRFCWKLGDVKIL